MKLLYSGFNGFNQVSSVQDTYLQTFSVIADKVHDVCVLWSDLIIFESDDGHTTQLRRSSIEEVFRISHSKVKQVCQGEGLLLVLSDSGELWKRALVPKETSWSRVTQFVSTESKAKDNEAVAAKIVKIACGDKLNIALDSAGRAYSIPSLIPSFGLKVADICCGKEHSLLLTTDGVLLSFGGGSRGQLGHGTLDSLEEPQLLDFFGGLTVTRIAAGGWHSAAVTDSGDLYMWGWNESGQLALPTAKNDVDRQEVAVQSTPHLTDWPTERDDWLVVHVGCGSRHTVVALDDNSIWSWGWNKYGQLGTGDCVSRDKPTRVFLSGCNSSDACVAQITCAGWSSALLIHTENQ